MKKSNKRSTKILSILLAILMMMSVIPFGAMTSYAAEYTGTFGDNLTWALDTTTGVLEITGDGSMGGSTSYPWASYKSNIKSVIIGEGVTSIGIKAFYGYSNLKSVDISGSVKEIGDDAFYNSGLESIVIPDGVEKIGGWAFSRCASLKSVYMADSVTKIDQCLFHLCTALESVKLSNSLTKIPDRTFYSCSSLESIEIPEGVTSIGYCSVFASCTSLKSVSLPETLTEISDGAFKSCSSLTELYIPESVTSISYDTFDKTPIYDDPANWDGDAFYYSNLLIYAKKATGDFVVREGTRAIADDCFHGGNITSITIPGSVKEIGSSAFYFCDKLTNVEMSEGLKKIGSSAFTYSKITSIEIPDSVTYIGGYVFSDCTKLENVKLSANLEYLYQSAFSGDTKLKSIVLPDGLKVLGNGAFYNCKLLEDVNIPENIVTLGSDAFKGTAYYNNADSWEDDVLYKDNALLSAKTTLSGDYEIKEGTRIIAGNAFKDCMSLTGITIPESVEIINTQAFYCCSALKNVFIPKTVTSIASNAFGYIGSTSKLSDFSISGICGSEANRYATANGIEFIATHDLTTIEAVEPTCTETGLTEGLMCAGCGEIFTAQEIIPALGHTEGEAVIENTVDSTCSAEGAYDEVIYCSDCGIELSRETKVIDKKAHTEAAAVVENVELPDCVTEGSYDEVVYCADCGVELSREAKVIPALGHDIVIEEYVAPTCTKAGLTEGRYCTRCDKATVAQTLIPAKGHECTVASRVEPTCEKEGSIKYVCDCGYTYTVAIAANGHTEVTDKAVAATCATSGLTEGKHCSVCGKVTLAQKVVPAKAHTYKATVTQAKCTVGGYTTYTCVDCGERYVTDYTEAKGHNMTEIVIPATCEENGYVIHTCKNCNYEADREILFAKGHVDADGDNECDNCWEYMGTMGRTGDAAQDCDCMCHAGGIYKFLYLFVKFFWQIAGKNKTCACGAGHY